MQRRGNCHLYCDPCSARRVRASRRASATFLRGGSGGTPHPTGTCELRACSGSAYGGKPYCTAHVDHMPYVAELLADMPLTPEEVAEDARAAREALLEIIEGRGAA